jgi:1,4-dihydroxy-2-naphthoate octaprenyltransferase
MAFLVHKKFIIWLKALRAEFLTATIVPFLLGGAITFYDSGSLNLFLFMLSGIGAACLHLGTNVANDYYDHKYNADNFNQNSTAFSGGSRVIQQGMLSPRTLFVTFTLFFIIGIALGIYLYLITKAAGILVIAAFGFFCGYFYTAGPIKLAYRGLGEIAIGLNLGPFITLGTYLVQTGKLSWEVFLSALPTGLLMLAMIILNEFPDHDSDKQAQKNTLVVRIGKKKAVSVLEIILLLTLLYILIGTFFGLYPAGVLIMFLAAPLAIKTVLIARKHYNNTPLLLPALQSNILFHLVSGLLLSGGFVLSAFL